jgi:hypothetical protein
MKQTPPTGRGEAVQTGLAEGPVSEMEERVVALLNAAVPEHTCLMCGQNANFHAEGCPIAGLAQWLNPFSDSI